MKQLRILGAGEAQLQDIYEESVLSTLRPKVVLDVACGRDKTVVLLADGNVYEFPKSACPRLVVGMPERTRGRVVKVSAGDSHFVAITDHLVWNVYSWGSSNAEGQLGRDARTQEQMKIPGVVCDIAGRVVDVSCGADFTLCATSTGDLWGFGNRAYHFGQPSVTVKEQHSSVGNVVKLHWAGEPEDRRITGALTADRESQAVHFASSRGNLGLVWRTAPSSNIDNEREHLQINGRQHKDQLDDPQLATPSRAALTEWFQPSDDVEHLIARHSQQAWSKASRLAEAVRLNLQRESEVSERVQSLEARLALQEEKTASYASRMLRFADLEGFVDVEEIVIENQRKHVGENAPWQPSETTPEDAKAEETLEDRRTSPLAAVQEAEEGEEEEGGFEADEQEAETELQADVPRQTSRASLSTGAQSSSDIKSVIQASRGVKRRQPKHKVPSRIRDRVLAEMAEEEQTRRRDAEICRKQLNDAVEMLAILQQELSLTKEELERVRKDRKDSEVSAWDWNTRALLFDRAMLRLKRESRAKAGFQLRTGVTKAFPTSSWTRDLPRRVRLIADDAEVWVLSRLDPDWGLRIAVASIRLKSKVLSVDHGDQKLIKVFISPVAIIQKDERQGMRPKPEVPMRYCSPSAEGEAIVLELQRHAVFQARQIGEDTAFWVGFSLTDAATASKLADEFTTEKAELDVELHGDEQVARRVKDEAEEVGPFHPAIQSEWERLQLEVLEDTA